MTSKSRGNRILRLHEIAVKVSKSYVVFLSFWALHVYCSMNVIIHMTLQFLFV